MTKSVHMSLIKVSAIFGLLFLGGCGDSAKDVSHLPYCDINFAEPCKVGAAVEVNDPDKNKPKPEIRQKKYTGDKWYVASSRPWKFIVIHHSAGNSGSADAFDRFHTNTRGWDELGYHFVITNGKGGPDGQVQMGSRWKKQKWGAHCGGTPDNEYNNYGIGICLVGDFRKKMPTKKQLESLEKLTKFLVAAYAVKPDNVLAHRDAPNANTACCGRKLWVYIHGSNFKAAIKDNSYLASSQK